MRIVGQQEDIEVDIVNHFYVTGMDIDRKLNANLQDYRMVQRGNTLQYVHKSKYIEESEEARPVFQTEKQLENLLKLKKYYKITLNESTLGKKSRGSLQDGTDSEIIERGKYDQSSFIQKEAKKSFKEFIREEYQLMRVYRTKELKLEQEPTAQTGPRKIKIDKSRLNDEDYVMNLHKDMQEDQFANMMSLNDYTEKELEETDLFLFLKFINTKVYDKHIKSQSDLERQEQTIDE